MFTGDAASAVVSGPGVQDAGQVLVDTARGCESARRRQLADSLHLS
jgi:hypothetical protein